MVLSGWFLPTTPPPPLTLPHSSVPSRKELALPALLPPGFEVPEDGWDQVSFQGPEDSSARPLLPRHPKDALVGGQE